MQKVLYDNTSCNNPERRMTAANAAPPSIEGARTYARQFAERAIDTLVNLMDNATSEHVRLAAAKELMKLGCGKAIKPAREALPDSEDEVDRERLHARLFASSELSDSYEKARRESRA